jgi:hypothetical protein
MANILGISIGTRNVGLAVIRLRRLTDYRIRTFAGKWTPTKCEAIFTVIEAVIKQNSITDITLKIPPPSHCSENIRELINGINELGRWFHIEVHHCTIRDLKLPYAEKGNKQIMVAALIEKYPELKKEWHGGKRAQAYNAKLFEAIACAELALRAGH